MKRATLISDGAGGGWFLASCTMLRFPRGLPSETRHERPDAHSDQQRGDERTDDVLSGLVAEGNRSPQVHGSGEDEEEQSRYENGGVGVHSPAGEEDDEGGDGVGEVSSCRLHLVLSTCLSAHRLGTLPPEEHPFYTGETGDGDDDEQSQEVKSALWVPIAHEVGEEDANREECVAEGLEGEGDSGSSGLFRGLLSFCTSCIARGFIGSGKAYHESDDGISLDYRSLQLGGLRLALP